MIGAQELGLALLLFAACDAAADRPAPRSAEPPPLMERTVVDRGAPHTAEPLLEAKGSERPPARVEVEHEQPGGEPLVSDDSLVPPPVQASEPEPAPVPCCRTCHKGKACGDSCIAKSSRCTKAPGCACDG